MVIIVIHYNSNVYWSRNVAGTNFVKIDWALYNKLTTSGTCIFGVKYSCCVFHLSRPDVCQAELTNLNVRGGRMKRKMHSFAQQTSIDSKLDKMNIAFYSKELPFNKPIFTSA